jgi:hypothetical protein
MEVLSCISCCCLFVSQLLAFSVPAVVINSGDECERAGDVIQDGFICTVKSNTDSQQWPSSSFKKLIFTFSLITEILSFLINYFSIGTSVKLLFYVI